MAEEVKAVMVEIKDKPEPEAAKVPVTTGDMNASGADPREVTMAKELGIAVEGEQTPEKKEPEKSDPEKKEPEKSDPEKKEEIPPDAEAAEIAAMADPAKEATLLKTYNANEKALYYRQKKARLRAQSAERERDFLKTQNEALRRKAEKEADPNAELKRDLEELDADGNVIDKTKTLTVADLEKREKDKLETDNRAREAARVINERLQVLNDEAKNKYDDFDEVMDLAKEVMEADKYGVYAMKLVALTADPNGNPAEYAYTLGKLHANYGKHRKDKAPDPAAGGDSKKVAKIVENASKRTPSAALGGASEKGRLVSEDDLTVEDVAGMSQSAYNNLSDKTRNRLLRESSSAAR